MRANINLYKDEDVIASLEQKLGALTLDSTATGKSPADAALDKGTAEVAGTTRKVVKAKRTTEASTRE